MGILSGKTALVVGIATNRSIAYGAACSLKKHGADLILTYQSEKLKSRVEKIADELDALSVIPCDVSLDNEINQLMQSIAEKTKN